MPVYDESEGYIKVEVRSPDGTPVEGNTLDLYEAHSTYLALVERHQEDSSDLALGDAWTQWLRERGLPLSHLNAFRLWHDIARRVAEFKKKHDMAPPSPTPASSGSSESASPA